MSILLNIIVLLGCLWWLYKSSKSNGILIGIAFAFLGGTFISLVIASFVEHEYLDGLTHFIVTIGAIVLFWALSILLLVLTSRPLTYQVIPKFFILSIPLFAILLIYQLISNMTFKIGG